MPQDRRDHWALLAVLLGLVVSLLPSLLMGIALPFVLRRLAMPLADSAMPFAAYHFGLLVALLPATALCDSLGRRPVFLGGLVLLSLATLGCGLADALAPLLALRALQGLAAAATLTAAFGQLRLLAMPQGLGLRLGWAALAGLLTTLMVPWLAGWLMMQGGLSLVMLPLPLLALPAGLLALRSWAQPAGPRPPFDLLGALLGALSCGLLFLSLQAVLGTGQRALWLLVFGLVALLLLVLQQSRRATPSLPLDLLRQPRIAAACLAAFAMALALMALQVALLPFLIEHARLQQTRLPQVMVALPVAAGLAGFCAGWLADRVAPALPRLLGGLLLAGGLVLLVWLSPGGSPGGEAVALPLLVLLACGTGAGLCQVTNQRVLLAAAPPQRASAPAGLLVLAETAGTALGPYYAFLPQVTGNHAALQAVGLSGSGLSIALQLAALAALAAGLLGLAGGARSDRPQPLD